MSNDEMYVTKRSGSTEIVSFDKILHRIKTIGTEAGVKINYTSLAMKIIDQLYDKISTTKIDDLTAEQCAALSSTHYDYGTIASHIVVSNHHKSTVADFREVVRTLFHAIDKNGNVSPLLSKDIYNATEEHADAINAAIDFRRDYLIDYFGFRTLEKSYLMRSNGVIIERPQHMWMRVALGIHGTDIDAAIETYHLMSQKYFTHATPTLFNAGTPRPQLSSCFLIAMEEDSIGGIYNTLKDCALISKWAGGIGMHIHNVRATGSQIRGTNGNSNGIVPMLRVFNNTAKYVDQGGGRRNGSFAIYLEPWHADIEMFLEMRKNHGDEELKARDLFYALWVPDLFMERVKADGTWTLMCPNECPGLADVYGQAFAELYTKYEQAGKGRTTVKARELWFKVLDAQMETGTPYICYKDAANRKSNQQNVGTIKSSNLCAEILEYSDENETAVCNLASIALPTFVENGAFNYDKLADVAGVITRNLNRVIDINYYPTDKTRVSNMRHRPIGIGVQGLADVFLMMNVAYHSDEARELNRLIFETIYYGAVKASADLAVQLGPYPSFAGSPASKGQLQFDLWNVEPTPDRYDWTAIKAQIQATGMRNSLLLAPMPTASTSQILGFNECFEPFTSNIYSRRTMAGEFILTNKYLMRELIALGLWNTELKNNIIANQGSIQHIENLPEDMKQRYKTVWEIPMRHVIDMAAERGAFICQSQSLNLWIEDPTYNSLTSMHFYSWSKGLKTGIYYLRRRGKHRAQQFTIEPKNGGECELCSS